MKKIALLIFSVLIAGNAWAITARWNGFLSVVGGKVISGDVNQVNYNEKNCPCFVADYHEGVAYEDEDFSLTNESRIGGQLNLGFTDELSFVTQIVVRDQGLNLSWAYLSWGFQPNWTLQLGRKRIPLYSKSEIQDVGFAYDWLRPPQALYGWEVDAYNGLNLRYSNQWREWDWTLNGFFGEDEVKDSGYSRIYNLVKQDVRWKKIRGFEISAAQEEYTLRWVYMSSENSLTDKPFEAGYFPAVEQTVMGLALDVDYETWFMMSELNLNRRNNPSGGYKIKAPAAMLALGYRWSSWTLLISGSRYWETSSNEDNYLGERFIDTSLTLRYDLSDAQSIKWQIDQLSDQSQSDFVGSTSVISISYDWAF